MRQRCPREPYSFRAVRSAASFRGQGLLVQESLTKGIPTFFRERDFPPALGDEQNVGFADYAADQSERGAGNAAWNERNILGRDGEEEFIVVAAVQSQFQGVEFLCVQPGKPGTRNP